MTFFYKKGKLQLAFLFENGEVYNCLLKKQSKAPKNFVKTYEAVKPLIDEKNKSIIEVATGHLRHPETPSQPFGLFILTEDMVYFGFLKKKEPILKEWSFDSIFEIDSTKKALTGYRIDCKASDADFTVANISVGDPEAFVKYLKPRIEGNEERFTAQKEKAAEEIKTEVPTSNEPVLTENKPMNEPQLRQENKSDKKEYYFKTNKTTITLDGNFVRMTRKGVINAVTRGFSGEKSYRISELSGVQIKKPGLVTSGYFQFLTPSANETKGLWEATQDDNTFNFGPDELPMVLEIQKYIEEHQAAPAQSAAAAAPTPAPSISVADELKKYKELLDMDAITQEEYEIKKKQLLNL
ncbi:DUF4429 domain-containing protein [Bacillus subtilis]|nr:DUF4429 domain-containing protein [Bacillus subtilis]